jgi:hypothetical protein
LAIDGRPGNEYDNGAVEEEDYDGGGLESGGCSGARRDKKGGKGRSEINKIEKKMVLRQ